MDAVAERLQLQRKGLLQLRNTAPLYRITQRKEKESPPETLSIQVDPRQSLYHNLMFVQILLQLVYFGGNGALLVAHCVEALNDLLLGLFVLHAFLFLENK